MKFIEDFKTILASTITSMMDQINMSTYSLYHRDAPKAQEHTTVVPEKGGLHHWAVDNP